MALREALETEDYRARVVRGKFRDRKGHAWLKVHETIVDITADQFGKFPSVCVLDTPHRLYRETIGMVGDPQFDRDMGQAGDGGQFNDQTRGLRLGTSKDIAQRLLSIFDDLGRGD